MAVCFTSYEPFYDIERIVDEVLFPLEARRGANRVQVGGTQNTARSLKPRMDLHEDSKKNLVTATFEFPGVSKENIHIDIHLGKLTVSTETKQSNERDENGYVVRERRYGKYSRTLQLPHGIKDEEIQASMENGVLTITFPKSSPELAPKRVNVA
jgi:HSP20 family protein